MVLIRRCDGDCKGQSRGGTAAKVTDESGVDEEAEGASYFARFCYGDDGKRNKRVCGHANRGNDADGKKAQHPTGDRKSNTVE
ncbi:hypothetical protein L596_011976 [Steinernema carpocapsae]|uniref:Uncharacterized protein n=1 Tax=Steinernema carpocapsae TaxID=34508 RepID=A0A4U5NWI4_STECR|nr:hypothetical protein L596_011976 [Steinernema carpocapsae]